MTDTALEKREIKLIARYLKKNKLKYYNYIEVGCGDGLNLEVLSKSGLFGIGMDISEEAIRVLTSKNIPNTEAKLTNFLEYEGETDMIFMLHLLEHVENDKEFIDKAYDVLKENGYFIVSVPIKQKLYGYSDANAGHVKRFEMDDLLSKLKKFKIKKIYNIGFPVTVFYYWFFNVINKNKKVNPKNLQSGIQNKENYYPGMFNQLSKIAFPILYYLNYLDVFFHNTNLGNETIVICKK